MLGGGVTAQALQLSSYIYFIILTQQHHVSVSLYVHLCEQYRVYRHELS